MPSTGFVGDFRASFRQASVYCTLLFRAQSRLPISTAERCKDRAAHLLALTFALAATGDVPESEH
jgi:hypothetical protein